MGFLTYWYLYAVHHPVDTTWTGIGFLGNAIFGLRFLVQWLKSEQEGHSIIPLAFWYISVAGSLITLTYAIHIHSLPFMVSQVSMLVYLRNIWMIYRDRRRATLSI